MMYEVGVKQFKNTEIVQGLSVIIVSEFKIIEFPFPRENA